MKHSFVVPTFSVLMLLSMLATLNGKLQYLPVLFVTHTLVAIGYVFCLIGYSILYTLKEALTKRLNTTLYIMRYVRIGLYLCCCFVILHTTEESIYALCFMCLISYLTHAALFNNLIVDLRKEIKTPQK